MEIQAITEAATIDVLNLQLGYPIKVGEVLPKYLLINPKSVLYRDVEKIKELYSNSKPIFKVKMESRKVGFFSTMVLGKANYVFEPFVKQSQLVHALFESNSKRIQDWELRYTASSTMQNMSLIVDMTYYYRLIQY